MNGPVDKGRRARASSRAALDELLRGKSLILVSNRGPVEFRNVEGKLVPHRGAGGLVTAMLAIGEATGATWISAPMTAADRTIAQQNEAIGVPPEDPKYVVRFVRISKRCYEDYYNVISNPLLWFIAHYIWDLVREPVLTADMSKAWSQGYVKANRLFAEAVLAEIRASSEQPVVMLQDYHLLVAPKFIKQGSARTAVAHFTHIPWPEAAYFRVLPSEIRVELLSSLLHADILGFQTRGFAANFMRCCEANLPCRIDTNRGTVTWEQRRILIRTYPISIDHNRLRAAAQSAPVLQHERRIVDETRGLKLIVRVDRADLSKNVVRGFLAYDRLLSRYPKLRGRVRFLALLYATRERIPEYARYKEEIEETVRRVNESYATPDWEPINLRFKDDYLESLAALRQYDVLLVNPVFDGMNLVAKEGPAINRRDGVLVLSENAGAFDELQDACVPVNPFAIDGTANALYQALMMPEWERRVRAERLREIVTKNDSIKWLYHQLRDIAALDKGKSTPAARRR